MDQAATLRMLTRHLREPAVRPREARERLRTIAIASGKGGVGKTNTALNLAVALSRRQRKVFLLDADMGLANVDVLLGLTPRYTLEHVLDGRKDIMEVVLEGPHGLKILPSGSGIGELSELSFETQQKLFREMRRIDEDMDYLFIDTGAGISSNVLRFNATAGEVILVTNPEPTSLTDAYALMKLLANRYGVRRFSLIANSVSGEKEGRHTFERLERACSQFLGVRLDFLGAVPFDKHVRMAVRQQRALLDLYPRSPAGRSLLRIAALMDQRGTAGAARPTPDGTPASVTNTSSPPSSPENHRSGYWDRLLHWKKVK